MGRPQRRVRVEVVDEAHHRGDKNYERGNRVAEIQAAVAATTSFPVKREFPY